LRGGPRAGRCDGRKLAHGAPSELQLPLVPRGPGVEVLHVQRSHPPASIVIAYYTFISLVSLLRPCAPRVATIIRSASHGLR
jgi:hypothetical protein